MMGFRRKPEEKGVRKSPLFLFTAQNSAINYFPLSMSSAMISRPPKQRIAAAFNLKASHYDANAVLQTRIIEKLLPIIGSRAEGMSRWADLGCGTGLLMRKLRKSAPPIRFIGMDIAPEPLRFLKEKADISLVQGDIDMLPFKKKSFDGIVVSSVLQWLDDPCMIMTKIAEMIRPGGHLVFSIFTSGSFAELFETRAFFGMNIPVICPDAGQIIRSFSDASLRIDLTEEISEKKYFPDAKTLLHSVGRIGGGATEGRRLSRAGIETFCAEYERRFRTGQGVPLTWRALVGACRKNIES